LSCNSGAQHAPNIEGGVQAGEEEEEEEDEGEEEEEEESSSDLEDDEAEMRAARTQKGKGAGKKTAKGPPISIYILMFTAHMISPFVSGQLKLHAKSPEPMMEAKIMYTVSFTATGKPAAAGRVMQLSSDLPWVDFFAQVKILAANALFQTKAMIDDDQISLAFTIPRRANLTALSKEDKYDYMVQTALKVKDPSVKISVVQVGGMEPEVRQTIEISSHDHDVSESRILRAATKRTVVPKRRRRLKRERRRYEIDLL
jgi:hypothetical protein